MICQTVSYLACLLVRTLTVVYLVFVEGIPVGNCSVARLYLLMMQQSLFTVLRSRRPFVREIYHDEITTIYWLKGFQCLRKLTWMVSATY